MLTVFVFIVSSTKLLVRAKTQAQFYSHFDLQPIKQVHCRLYIRLSLRLLFEESFEDIGMKLEFFFSFTS